MHKIAPFKDIDKCDFCGGIISETNPGVESDYDQGVNHCDEYHCLASICLKCLKEAVPIILSKENKK